MERKVLGMWEWGLHGRLETGADQLVEWLTPVCLRGLEQRQAKFLEHKLKCTKARNEYLLSLASVNAAVSNYYLHDVMDLMDVSAGWASWGRQCPLYRGLPEPCPCFPPSAVTQGSTWPWGMCSGATQLLRAAPKPPRCRAWAAWKKR